MGCQSLRKAMPQRVAPKPNVRKDSHQRGEMWVRTQLEGTSVRALWGRGLVSVSGKDEILGGLGACCG